MSDHNVHADRTAHEHTVLATIERVLAQPMDAGMEPGSLDELCGHLVQLAPVADPAFVAALDARIGAAVAQRTAAATTMFAQPSQALLPDHHPSRRVVRPSRVVLAVVALVALVIVLSLVLVPPVRARMQQYLERYGVVLVDPAAPTPAPVPMPVPGLVGSSRPVDPASLTLAEAQRAVPFRIRTPTGLPNDLRFVGAWVGDGPWGCSAASMAECDTIKPPVQVSLTYRSAQNPDAHLTVEITEITPEGGGGYVFSADAAEDVQVNGHPGVYVHGAWRSPDAWDSGVDAGNLAWEADGVTYRLASWALGWSKADHVRMAESLQ